MGSLIKKKITNLPMRSHCFNLRDFDFPNPVSYGIGTKCERQSSHVPWIVSDIYVNLKRQKTTTIEGKTFLCKPYNK